MGKRSWSCTRPATHAFHADLEASGIRTHARCAPLLPPCARHPRPAGLVRDCITFPTSQLQQGLSLSLSLSLPLSSPHPKEVEAGGKRTSCVGKQSTLFAKGNDSRYLTPAEHPAGLLESRTDSLARKSLFFFFFSRKAFSASASAEEPIQPMVTGCGMLSTTVKSRTWRNPFAEGAEITLEALGPGVWVLHHLFNCSPCRKKTKKIKRYPLTTCPKRLCPSQTSPNAARPKSPTALSRTNPGKVVYKSQESREQRRFALPLGNPQNAAFHFGFPLNQPQKGYPHQKDRWPWVKTPYPQ